MLSMASPYLACIALVSAFYHLPPRVLTSIQTVEGGRPGMVSTNTDGSADLGIMQINTRWIAALATSTGLPEGVVRNRLINEPCFNIATAGAILRIYLNEERGNLLRAVGNYHSHTPWRNESYQTKVLVAAERLFGQPPNSTISKTLNPTHKSAAAAASAQSAGWLPSAPPATPPPPPLPR
jgi:hypothetical protein